jgi:hypothetical protein
MPTNLPWQDIITGLIVVAALVYLGRRWWPGRPSQAACHGGGAVPAVAGSACGGGCSGCGTKPMEAAPIKIQGQRAAD